MQWMSADIKLQCNYMEALAITSGAFDIPSNSDHFFSPRTLSLLRYDPKISKNVRLRFQTAVLQELQVIQEFEA